MNSFYSSTQVDDDVFTPWADPLWVTGGQDTSARQGIHHHNFNATNDMVFSPAPITTMETFTRILTQENSMYPVSKRWFKHRQ